jgi:hypothetical protein
MLSSKPSSIRREQKLRLTIRSRLAEWAETALAPIGHAPAPHHLLLLQKLEAMSSGEAKRLAILMPPGSAKSTYASVLFPAWWFTQHPRSSIILASHTASLAEHFARRLRATIAEHSARLGYALAEDDRSAQRFTTTRGGEFLAAGVRGAIIGRRADLVIIDDPVRSQAEADSAAARTHLHDWFRADLTSRLKPGGRMLLIMTRWHHDDLAGRLLRPAPDHPWQVLRLPALAEADDPLGRQPGDPLWPAWEDAEALAARQLAVGPRMWAALYQQTPMLLRDALFKTTLLGMLDVLPAAPADRCVRAWDLAATAQSGAHDPDWTVGLKLIRRAAGDFVIADVVRLRGDPPLPPRGVMRADLLNVVTCVANPLRWASRIAFYRAFEEHMLDTGVALTVVECAHGDRPFEIDPRPGVRHIGVRAKSLVWNKENLLNLAIARLPDDWRYVAWIDADIRFRKPGWAAETVHALQQYDIVQPWSDCYDLGPNDDHLHTHRSFCRQFVRRQGKPIRRRHQEPTHPA